MVPPNILRSVDVGSYDQKTDFTTFDTCIVFSAQNYPRIASEPFLTFLTTFRVFLKFSNFSKKKT